MVAQAGRQTGRHTGRQTDRQTHRQTDRQTDRQTGRHTGRQTGRQTGNQSGRQTSMVTDAFNQRSACWMKHLKRASAIEEVGTKRLAWPLCFTDTHTLMQS